MSTTHVEQPEWSLWSPCTLKVRKRDIVVRNKPRVEVEGERWPRGWSGRRRRFPVSDERLFWHHVQVQDDVAVALLLSICTKNEQTRQSYLANTRQNHQQIFLIISKQCDCSCEQLYRAPLKGGPGLLSKTL